MTDSAFGIDHGEISKIALPPHLANKANKGRKILTSTKADGKVKSFALKRMGFEPKKGQGPRQAQQLKMRALEQKRAR